MKMDAWLSSKMKAFAAGITLLLLIVFFVFIVTKKENMPSSITQRDTAIADTIGLVIKPGIDDFTVCYEARKLVLNYVRNPLEADISNDCGSVLWKASTGTWLVNGRGTTKTDFGVKKGFSYFIQVFYSYKDQNWKAISCDIIKE